LLVCFIGGTALWYRTSDRVTEARRKRKNGALARLLFTAFNIILPWFPELSLIKDVSIHFVEQYRSAVVMTKAMDDIMSIVQMTVEDYEDPRNPVEGKILQKDIITDNPLGVKIIDCASWKTEREWADYYLKENPHFDYVPGKRFIVGNPDSNDYGHYEIIWKNDWQIMRSHGLNLSFSWFRFPRFGFSRFAQPFVRAGEKVTTGYRAWKLWCIMYEYRWILAVCLCIMVSGIGVYMWFKRDEDDEFEILTPEAPPTGKKAKKRDRRYVWHNKKSGAYYCWDNDQDGYAKLETNDWNRVKNKYDWISENFIDPDRLLQGKSNGLFSGHTGTNALAYMMGDIGPKVDELNADANVKPLVVVAPQQVQTPTEDKFMVTIPKMSVMDISSMSSNPNDVRAVTYTQIEEYVKTRIDQTLKNLPVNNVEHLRPNSSINDVPDLFPVMGSNKDGIIQTTGFCLNGQVLAAQHGVASSTSISVKHDGKPLQVDVKTCRIIPGLTEHVAIKAPVGVKSSKMFKTRLPIVGESVTLFWCDQDGKVKWTGGIVKGREVYQTKDLLHPEIVLYTCTNSSMFGACGGIYKANSDGAVVGIHGVGESKTSALVKFHGLPENFNSIMQNISTVPAVESKDLIDWFSPLIRHATPVGDEHEKAISTTETKNSDGPVVSL